MWRLRIIRELQVGTVLLAALVAGCAQQPLAAPVASVRALRLPANLQVQDISLHGPAQGDDLLAALRTLAGNPLDAALTQAAEAYVRDYYDWLEWRNVRVFIDSAPDASGTLHLVVTADAPAQLAEPPFDPPVASTVPAPREPGGARNELALDDSFRPWLQSGSRILVDAQERRLYLRHDDGRVQSYAVAVGTARTPTPPGQYVVEAIRHQPTWYPPASIRREYANKGKPLPAFVPPGADNPLGSYFVKLQNSLGIHGTNQPRSIGRAASHGCIRMHDRDVRELIRYLRRGDAITIVRARPALTATR